MPAELQSTSSAFTACIAEYVSQMDEDEAAAYRRADGEQQEANRLLKEANDARL